MTAQAPTTDGVIASLRTMSLQGMTVGVQLYNDSNPPLEQFLREAGAKPITVQPYIYAPASDTERVGEFIERMAAGKVDAIIFTSARRWIGYSRSPRNGKRPLGLWPAWSGRWLPQLVRWCRRICENAA